MVCYWRAQLIQNRFSAHGSGNFQLSKFQNLCQIFYLYFSPPNISPEFHLSNEFQSEITHITGLQQNDGVGYPITSSMYCTRESTDD